MSISSFDIPGLIYAILNIEQFTNLIKYMKKQTSVSITQTPDQIPEKRKLSLVTREKISLSKTKYTKELLIEEGIKYINSIIEADPALKLFPSIVGLCLYIGISKSRLYELASLHSEVSDILEYVSNLQEQTALEGGITQRLNPIFSMFILKSKHGYQDTAPQLTQTNNFNISPDLLSDALKLMGKNPTSEK